MSTMKTLSIVAASALAGSAPSHFPYVERHKERFAFSQRDENLGRRLNPKRDSFLWRVVHPGTANLQSPVAASSATGLFRSSDWVRRVSVLLLRHEELRRVTGRYSIAEFPSLNSTGKAPAEITPGRGRVLWISARSARSQNAIACTLMAKDRSLKFECPACRARYDVVAIKGGSDTRKTEFFCLIFQEPLPTHDGDNLLKYFLTSRSIAPGAQAPRTPLGYRFTLINFSMAGTAHGRFR